MSSTVQLPEDCDAIQDELRKQESLLAQIHYEMNSGFISKKREELLWEVQRMITQLKVNIFILLLLAKLLDLKAISFDWNFHFTHFPKEEHLLPTYHKSNIHCRS